MDLHIYVNRSQLWFFIWSIMFLMLTFRGLLEAQEYYSFCDTDFLFCFYSTGDPSKVTSLKDANTLCQKASAKGRVVDMDYPEVKDNLDKFMLTNSLRNIVLNAKVKNGKWVWAESEMDIKVISQFQVKGDLLMYETDESETYFLVCMSDCRAFYTEQKGYGGDDKDLRSMSVTLEVCKLTCDQNKVCEGFDVKTYLKGICLLFMKPGIAVKKKDNTVTHYAINRSVKTVDFCIGPIKPKMKGRDKSKDSQSKPKPKPNPSVVPGGGNAKGMTPKQTAGEKESEKSDRERFELDRPKAGAEGKDKDKIDHPWVTYLVASFVSAILVMICYGISRRRQELDESSSEDY